MLNHITIMGRLTRDPELRYTQSQTPVASFTLAVDRDFGGRDGGERQTDFIFSVCGEELGFLGCALIIVLLLAIVVRCLLGSLFAGNASALLFSLLGGLAAMLVMIALHALPRLSVYGVSVGGAAAHNCGQVAAAMLTLGSAAPLAYLPFLLVVSVFTGALTGFVAALLFRAMRHARAK